MFLEQRLQGVSNRCSLDSAKAKQYSAEIKEATALIKEEKSKEDNFDSLQEKLHKPIEELDLINLDYASPDNQGAAGVDYESLFSYLGNKTNSPEEIYQQKEETSEQTSSIMTDEEAEETVKKIQISYLTGNQEDLSYEEKEKFHHWQEFNKSTLILLYHQLSPIRTGNVDYSRLN